MSPDEWTSDGTLYAHYQRWCFFTDASAVALDTFAKRLDRKHGKRVKEQHGHRLYPLALTGSVTAHRKAEPHVDKVIGQVRVLEDLIFTDEVLKAGTVLEKFEPRSHERSHLNAINGVVVIWRGKRRYLRGKDVTRVLD